MNTIIPFAFYHKYTKSLMYNDYSDKIMIFMDPGYSFIIERKSIDELIEEIKEIKL